MINTNENKQNPSVLNFLVIVCLSAVLGLAGCEQEGTAEKTGKKIDRAAEKAEQKIEQAAEKADQKIEAAKESMGQQAGKTEDYLDDSMITLKVKTEFLNDPLLKATQIEVTTLNGVVKLSGTVDSEQSIARALEVAGSQKNVKSVQNELTVKASKPSE